MPRARKTQTGASAMSVQDVPGQQYGAQVEQQQLQQALPAPSARPVQAPSAGGAPAATPPAAAAAGPVAPTDPFAAAAGVSAPALFAAPTARPNEPITHGLPSGPGGGPEVLTAMYGSPLGDTLRKLSTQTGDQLFARLAQQAGL